MNSKNQIIAGVSIYNLNYLIEFHNYVRGLLKDEFQNLKKLDIKDREKNIYREKLKNYDRNLHINTFLMMYSYLEECLYIYWKEYAPKVKLEIKKGSIGRFKNIVKQLGVDLSSNCWQVIMEAEEIRNCLLHANGRISLLKDSKKVKNIIKKDSGLTISRDRVVIYGEYLQKLNENIANLINTLNSQVQAPV
ncbi:MAG: hypothetical protein KBG40_08680 [Bacteroidales bacterium]|nr:hypothetical protein [Bacteroidales bacterium]